MICKLGTFVEFSVMREPVTVDWTIIGNTKELNVHGAHLSPHTYPIAISMIEKGLLPMDRIVTNQLPLAESQAGNEMVANGETSIKVALSPKYSISSNVTSVVGVSPASRRGSRRPRNAKQALFDALKCQSL